MEIDEAMVAGVRAARRAGIRTAMLSNSWGEDRYDRAQLEALFDAWVISGEVGMRKPDPAIYELAAERLGLAPARVRVRRRPARQPQAGAGARDGHGRPPRRRGGDAGRGLRAARRQPALIATTPASVSTTPSSCERATRSASTTRASTTVTAG